MTSAADGFEKAPPRMMTESNRLTDGGPRRPPAVDEISGVSRRGMRAAIIGSCFKVLSSLSFSNGLMLVFLSALKMDGATVMLLLSLVNILQAVFLIPCAHLADRLGKRRITLTGIGLCGLGYALLPAAGLLPARLTVGLLGLGMALYGVGQAGQVASWYALLAPLVPSSYRGRFFGALRVSWQLCGVILAALIAWLLPHETSLSLLRMILIVTGLTIVPWALYYARIPELERESFPTRDLPKALGTIVRSGGYLPFCAYLFIIALFSGGCPVLFGLVEKRVLELGDGAVMLLANLTMIGSVIGYYIGGKAVDRVGTKSVFLICHFGYGFSLALFVARNSFPVSPLVVIGVAHAVFGALLAAGSIAFSTEMLALIPPARKSLSTSICTTMSQAGTALSGLLGAWSIRLGLFADTWTLAGHARSAYDAILLVYAVMIVLMAVTLGLIPSVVGRPELRAAPPVAG